jgi:hypothetical protein
LVFAETQKVIEEAKKQYVAFNNYMEYLDKKIMAFQQKKVEVFQEKHDLKEEYTKEFMKDIKERKRILILEERNIDVDPSSSRNAEEDYAEMKELKQKLEPSLAKTEQLEAKIKELQFSETRQSLLHEVDVLESMFHEVEWSIVKAEIYEVSQKTYAEALKTVFKTLSKQEQEKHYFPKPQDKFWNTLDWKPYADKLYSEARNGYYESLEKQKKEQEKAEWKRQKQLYKELEQRKEEEKI